MARNHDKLFFKWNMDSGILYREVCLKVTAIPLFRLLQVCQNHAETDCLVLHLVRTLKKS